MGDIVPGAKQRKDDVFPPVPDVGSRVVADLVPPEFHIHCQGYESELDRHPIGIIFSGPGAAELGSPLICQRLAVSEETPNVISRVSSQTTKLLAGPSVPTHPQKVVGKLGVHVDVKGQAYLQNQIQVMKS
ncbi:MAG: hypothetical protein IPP31_04780 [Chitinophagaceae bacterium]|nr:hypothetical protein [Chitinophagaceae bacterium]